MKRFKKIEEQNFAEIARKFIRTLNEKQLLMLRSCFHQAMPLKEWGHYHYKHFVHEEMDRRGMLGNKENKQQ